MKLFYFHGFGSSAASGTIRTLREKLPDFKVIAPDIPVDPAEALPLLRELCEKEQPNVVVGTSMGGMYAQQMFGFNRICVNPAFFMSKTSKVLKVGTLSSSSHVLTDKRCLPLRRILSNILLRWKPASSMVLLLLKRKEYGECLATMILR